MSDHGAQYKLTGDELVDDVQRNHVQHMSICPVCTWWYCEHYECDCDLDHSLPIAENVTRSTP